MPLTRRPRGPGTRSDGHPTTAQTTTATLTAATPASVNPQLCRHDELKLAEAADALTSIQDQARVEGWSLTHALNRLLAIEVIGTDARRLSDRFRFANLPTGANLHDFDLNAASSIDRNLLAELGTCRNIETATNALLIRPPGVGKTHIDTAPGDGAVRADSRTYSPLPLISPPEAAAPRSRASRAK